MVGHRGHVGGCCDWLGGDAACGFHAAGKCFGVLAGGGYGANRVCENQFPRPFGFALCSSDRFLLFRAVPPGINMMAVPLVIGMLFVSVSDFSFIFAQGLASCSICW